ncbi:MAG TPA: glycosyltransferase family 39 protein [Thermoanaerobaculia bacterium]|nr:glycosyltransferase family 39 protein [Thermoanaerobaculia bacterium]
MASSILLNGRGAAVIPPALIAGTLIAGAAWRTSPRAFQVLVFAALLAALGSAGWQIARRLLPEAGRASLVTAAFTFAVALAAVPATWLGHFGLLRPAPFLAIVAAVFLLARLIPRPERREELPDDPGRLARAEAALVLAVVLLTALAWGKTAHGARYGFPGYYSFDDTYYHLTAVAQWHRSGDLRMVKLAMGDSSTTFYPIVAEICAWVFLAPFRDSDVAARWAQLPFALASLFAVAALARRLGVSRRAAGLAALLYAAVPEFFPGLALTAGNDHSAAFFTLAALDGALELGRRPRRGAAVYAGIALGLLAGTKYLALLYAAVLVGVAIVSFLAGRPRPSFKTLAGLLGLVAALALAAGGYTYLRNAVTAGNPLFPAPVSRLGLPGWESATLASRRLWAEFAIDVPSFLTARPDLLGRLFPFTLLPAALLAPFVALGRGSSWGRRIETALVFALPIVFFLQFRYLMHDHRAARYIFPAIALAAVAFVWLTERAGPRCGPLLRIAVLLPAAWELLRPLRLSFWVFPAIALVALGILFVRREGWRMEPRARLLAGGLAAALLALAAFPVGATIRKYQEIKFRQRPAALAFDRATAGKGARVAYIGWNQPYFFFGGSLQNDVFIVPRGGDLAAREYTWGGSAEFPFEGWDYKTWRANLERLGIEYLVVVRTGQGLERPERPWIVRHPGTFERFYRDSLIEIWRIKE